MIRTRSTGTLLCIALAVSSGLVASLGMFACGVSDAPVCENSGGRSDALLSVRGQIVDVDCEAKEFKIVPDGDMAEAIVFDYSRANSDQFDAGNLVLGECVEVFYFDAFSAQGRYLADSLVMLDL